MNGKNILVASLAGLAMIGVGTGWGYVHHTNHQLQTQLITKQHQIDRTQQDIKTKGKQAQQQFLSSATTNPDPKISSVFLQNQTTQQVSRMTSRFFATYYSFNSSEDYNTRKQTLLNQGIITSSLANNKDIFNSDKIAKGMNYVDIAQLNSQYISSYSFFPAMNDRMNTLDFLTQVKFQSNYTGQKSATSTMMYRVSYNLKSHKITNVVNEASLFDNTEALSNLKNDNILDNY